MTGGPIRIGVIDSGIKSALAGRLTASRSFIGDCDTSDAIGHGTRITEIIAEQADSADLISARVFGAEPVTQPAIIAQAVDWLTEQGAKLINMSFGLAADRTVVADACNRAARSGVVLIASAPARGALCFPARYDTVVSVTGDARCAKGEVSLLDGLAQFGTWCASPEREATVVISGASVAAAHFSGLAGRWLTDHPSATHAELIAHFCTAARFEGPERRARDGTPSWNG